MTIVNLNGEDLSPPKPTMYVFDPIIDNEDPIRVEELAYVVREFFLALGVAAPEAVVQNMEPSIKRHFTSFDPQGGG